MRCSCRSAHARASSESDGMAARCIRDFGGPLSRLQRSVRARRTLRSACGQSLSLPRKRGRRRRPHDRVPISSPAAVSQAPVHHARSASAGLHPRTSGRSDRLMRVTTSSQARFCSSRIFQVDARDQRPRAAAEIAAAVVDHAVADVRDGEERRRDPLIFQFVARRLQIGAQEAFRRERRVVRQRIDLQDRLDRRRCGTARRCRAPTGRRTARTRRPGSRPACRTADRRTPASPSPPAARPCASDGREPQGCDRSKDEPTHDVPAFLPLRCRVAVEPCHGSRRRRGQSAR